ncbi:MAG: hypothetical protein SH809_06655 [Rhodothermales bacterium]|nr:hypothetical protein [Rhodothermales bacterium]
MRNLLTLACLIVLLGVVAPAQAQLRETALDQRASTRLYDTHKSGFTLNQLFDKSHFRMSQSAEFSAGSYGGQTMSMGMFTNSMMWQFSSKLAARVDMSVAYSPNAGTLNSSQFGGGQSGDARVFLRNAEVAYRPSENVQLHLSIRQNPYGSYGSPYGHYNPYGYGSRSQMGFYRGSDDLFWNDNGR